MLNPYNVHDTHINYARKIKLKYKSLIEYKKQECLRNTWVIYIADAIKISRWAIKSYRSDIFLVIWLYIAIIQGIIWTWIDNYKKINEWYKVNW